MKNSRRVVVGLCVWLGSVLPCAAQAPSFVSFKSPDHNLMTQFGPNGPVSPRVTHYQGLLFAAVDDVATAVPLTSGPVIQKTQAIALPGTPPISYVLTFAQLGIVIPACNSAPCPLYTVVVLVIGSNGSSRREVLAESPPFSAPLPVQAPEPVLPPAGARELIVR